MNNSIKIMKETFKESFLQPQCYKGEDIEYELLESGLDVESNSYYCRLSANGYLDCTDWYGPFDTIEECADYLVETYGDS
jgi:hypothetical protein